VPDAIAYQLEYSVEADVTPSFAWNWRTDIVNWSDPPAQFLLDGPFDTGSWGTTLFPGQAPLRWQIRDVRPGRSFVIDMPLDRALLSFEWTFDAVSEGRTRITQRIVLTGDRATVYATDVQASFGSTLADGMTRIAEGMTRASEIRAATIGELKPLDGPIELVDYSPRWPALFAEEAVRVRSALGDKVLRLEHVGSTAVPGLVAKPIIDMVLVVGDSADETAYSPGLESLGYILRIREPGWHQHRMFKGRDPDINLHVFSAECPEIDRMLRFRDWLRGNAADRELYARTKTELAGKRWTYVQSYADAKTAVVAEIMQRAGGV